MLDYWYLFLVVLAACVFVYFFFGYRDYRVWHGLPAIGYYRLKVRTPTYTGPLEGHLVDGSFLLNSDYLRMLQVYLGAQGFDVQQFMKIFTTPRIRQLCTHCGKYKDCACGCPACKADKHEQCTTSLCRANLRCFCPGPVFEYVNVEQRCHLYIMFADIPIGGFTDRPNLLLSMRPLDTNEYRYPVQQWKTSRLGRYLEAVFDAECQGSYFGIDDEGQYHVWGITPKNQVTEHYDVQPDEYAAWKDYATAVPLIKSAARNAAKVDHTEGRLRNSEEHNKVVTGSNIGLANQIWQYVTMLNQPNPFGGGQPTGTQPFRPSTSFMPLLVGLVVFAFLWFGFPKGYQQFDQTTFAIIGFVAGAVGYWWFLKRRGSTP